MTDGQSQQDQIDALRVLIDQETLRNDSYRTFLQRWQTEISPVHEKHERSRELGSAYAQTGIRSMFILNGGALFVLPAFAGIAGVDIAGEMVQFASAIACFVVGLVFITLTSLFAYFSLDADVATLRRDEDILRLDLNKDQNPDGFTKEQEEQRKTSEQERKKFGGIANNCTKAAVALAVASLVTFVAGAIIGIFVIT